MAEHFTKTKWKHACRIAGMNDNGWTVKSTEWQIKGVKSVGRPNHRWRDDFVGQQGKTWTKDRESWGNLAEDDFL